MNVGLLMLSIMTLFTNQPLFTNQSTETQMLETGIKVVDLLAPHMRGGKAGLFGELVLENSRDYRINQQHCQSTWWLSASLGLEKEP